MRYRIKIITIALSLLLILNFVNTFLITTVKASSPDLDSEVKGYIVDSETNDPIENALVEILIELKGDDYFDTTNTDEFGYYEKLVPSGRGIINTSKEGYIPSSSGMVKIYSKQSNTVNITLTPEEEPNNPPNIPNNPNPEDNNENVSINTNLTWNSDDPDGDNVTFDVYFNDDLDLEKVADNISSNSFSPGELVYNKEYYWKIISWDENGESTDGPVWSFTTEQEVFEQLQILSLNSIIENETFEVEIVDELTDAVENAEVAFNGITDLTDHNGEVVFTAPEVESNQSYDIIASKEGYLSDSNSILVINNEPEEIPELIVTAPAEVNESEIFVVEVFDVHTDDVENAEVTFNDVTELTDVNGEVVFNSPGVEINTSYDITAEKEGYESDLTSILVIDVQSEEISELILSSPEIVNENESFTVHVQDNFGSAVFEAEVKFNSITNLTDINGSVDFTAPEVNENLTLLINASKVDYISNSTIINITNTNEADIESPVVVIENPINGTIFNTPNITVIGNATDNVGIVSGSYKQSYNNGGQGMGGNFNESIKNWSFNIDFELEVGVNIITITATDEAGNSGEDSIALIYQEENSTIQTKFCGYVYNSENSVPLEGVVVDVFYLDENQIDKFSSTTSDSLGYYDMNVEEIIGYEIGITYSKSGYYDEISETSYDIIENNTLWLNITMDPGALPANSTVCGYVTDSDTEDVVEGATVVLLYMDEQGNEFFKINFSDSEGFYSFIIPPGSVLLAINAEGYHQDYTGDFTIGANVTYWVNFSLNPFPAESAEISGIITDYNTGEPVEDASVSIFWYTSLGVYDSNSTYTDSNGFYSLNVPPGELSLDIFVVAEGYYQNHEWFNNVITIYNKTTWMNLTLTPEPPKNSVLHGYITDENTDDPIVGASVTLDWKDDMGNYDYSIITYTDTSGYFSFNLSEGYVDLFVEADDYYSNYTGYFDISIGYNETVLKNMTLSPEPPESSIICGYITDAITGGPIVNASVDLDWTDGNSHYSQKSTDTDSFGYYSFNVAEGYIDIFAQSQDYFYNSTGYFDSYIEFNETIYQNLSLINSKVQNLQVKDKKDGRLELYWEPLHEDAEIDYYRIYRDGYILSERVYSTSYIDTGLENGHSYTYQIRAYSYRYGLGSKSDPVSGTPTLSGGSGGGGSPSAPPSPSIPPSSEPETNSDPIANASKSDRYGFVGESIRFDGTASNDPDGDKLNYSWNFGDLSSGSGNVTNHNYNKEGEYTVILEVEDEHGAKDTDKIIVNIRKPNNPPSKPKVDGPTVGKVDQEYTFIAVSEDKDNDTIKYVFDWDDGSSSETQMLQSGKNATISHSYSKPGKYTIKVQAIDNFSASSNTQEHTILINAYQVEGEDISGYLVDEDNDDKYDKFYNEDVDKESDTKEVKKNKYLIDEDEDNKPEYYVDTLDGSVIKVNQPVEQSIDMFLVALFSMMTIGIIILVLLAIFLSKKKKKVEQ